MYVVEVTRWKCWKVDILKINLDKRKRINDRKIPANI